MGAQRRPGYWWRRPVAGLALRVNVWAARGHQPNMFDRSKCADCGAPYPCYVRATTDARVRRFADG